MSEESKNRHEDLLIELYKENQKFIDKAIFTVSSASVPLLANFYEKVDGFWSGFFLLLSLLLFIATIVTHLAAFIYAKRSCDLFLSSNTEKKNKAETKRKKSEKLDKIVLWIFVFALISVFSMLTTNLIIKMTKNNQNNQRIYDNAMNVPQSLSQEMRSPEIKALNIPSSIAAESLKPQTTNVAVDKPANTNEGKSE